MSRARTWRRIGALFAGVIIVAALASLYPLEARGREWSSAQWQQPYWLFALVAVPLATFWGSFGRDRRTARLRLGTIAPLAGGPRGWRARFRDLPAVLRTVGLAFCILALARPVSVMQPAVAEEEGIDLVVALDLSGSMQAVMDNLPDDLQRFIAQRGPGIPPTRLDAAKAVLRDFIGRRSSDRIGVVIFAKSAFVLSPPTLDYGLLDSLVSKMDLDAIDPNGTAIGDALGVAVARLRRSHAKSKGILLLTDGDNQGGKLSPEYAAELANTVGARIYSIQIGEGDIARIHHGFDLFGQPRFEKKAYPTNPELLKKLSEKTGGSMFVASDAAQLQATFHEALDQLEKTKFEAAQATYEDLFRYLLLPGVVLIALEALLGAWLLRRFP